MTMFRIKKAIDDTEGAMTVFGLFMLMTCIVIGGLGLDVANAYLARTQLQATTDAAAHAALYTRDSDTEANAIVAALDVVENMMPVAKYGQVIQATDIQFGTWDTSTGAFTPVSGSKTAVFVDSSRTTARSNPVGTYFLRIMGFNNWDVRRGAVYETYRPGCLREGFVARDIVDMQSNNEYSNGFCIHSNTHVEMNNANDYELGTVVSMPDKLDVVVPNDDLTSNPGLAQALRDASYQFRIINQLPSIIADLSTGGAVYGPSYITNSTVLTFQGGGFKASDLVPNRIHYVNCNGNQPVNFAASALIEDVVIVSNCQFHFAADAQLQNSIIATTNTAAKSIYAGAAFTLGKDDNCASGGDSKILTMGSIELTSQVDIYGSQMIAKDNIYLTANAVGIEGASLIAGGVISVTSNGKMGFCGGGMNNFEANYFRLVS